jgi:hypothetical protein
MDATAALIMSLRSLPKRMICAEGPRSSGRRNVRLATVWGHAMGQRRGIGHRTTVTAGPNRPSRKEPFREDRSAGMH